ncbi:MAG: phosphate acyltransferase PlsX [Oscillospiraceae bacterium]|nr:phosphate acyltransferase PlsX [Oscillospiraceae bacterium]
MKIVIDGMGGDNAPDEVIKGAFLAAKEIKEPDLKILITIDAKQLSTTFSRLGLPVPSEGETLDLNDLGMKFVGGESDNYNFDEATAQSNVHFVYSDGVIRVEDNPMEIRKSKKGTSMGVAFDLVKRGKADAIVSAGSTAALMVGGSMVIGRIKGIKRPALAPIMPSITGNYLLLDGGANLECRPEMLLQFAIMGSIYMNKVMGFESPRVGLLNIGTEKEKGRELELAAHELLINEKTINFIGNVEAREVPLGACDVIITDGYTGNIYLKTVEGMGGFMKSSMKTLFGKNFSTKIGYLFAKSGVADFSKKTDYREVGGSPLLGTAKPVIKAHGSSNSKAFKNAIGQAVRFVKSEAVNEIEKHISSGSSI